MLKRIGPVTAVLLLAVLLAFPPLAQSTGGVQIIFGGAESVSDSDFSVLFTLVNPSPYADGVVTLGLPPLTDVSDATGNLTCSAGPDSAHPLFCLLAVSAHGVQQITVTMHTLSGFQSDSVLASYSVPKANAQDSLSFTLSRPGSLASYFPPFASGLVLIFLGMVAWLLCALGSRFSSGRGMLSSPSKALSSHFIVSAIAANLFLALGVLLIMSPSFSTVSFLLFSLVFAAGFILLSYVTPQAEQDSMVMLSREELASERTRIRGLVALAREKFVRQEIDEPTFRGLVGEYELELTRLEALGGKPSSHARRRKLEPEGPIVIEERPSELPVERPKVRPAGIYSPIARDSPSFSASPRRPSPAVDSPPWVKLADELRSRPSETVQKPMAQTQPDEAETTYAPPSISEPAKEEAKPVEPPSEPSRTPPVSSLTEPADVTKRVKELLSPKEKESSDGEGDETTPSV